MPKTELTNEQSAELERAKQLFSSWRDTKSGRERIPDHLWNSAADLFGSGGRGESHPSAPTDPYVTVSRHTALVALVI